MADIMIFSNENKTGLVHIDLIVHCCVVVVFLRIDTVTSFSWKCSLHLLCYFCSGAQKHSRI